MDNGYQNNTSRVKSFGQYFRDAIKFYDLDKQFVVQAVFLLELAVVFGGYILAIPYVQRFIQHYEQFISELSSKSESGLFNLSVIYSESYQNLAGALISLLIFFVAIKAVSFIVSLLYGTQYFYSLSEPSFSSLKRIGIFFTRLPKILLFNVLFYAVFFLGTMLLLMTVGIAILLIPFLSVITFIVPFFALAVHALFVFKDLLIIEFDVGVFKNFAKTYSLTKGSRRSIIVNMLWPYLLGFLINIVSVDGRNIMLSLFVSSFLEVIVLFITRRLSVLMFMDVASLERKDKKAPPKNA